MSTLYRKYRPVKFSQIVGQNHVVRTLTNAIANERIGHAYLLTGPRGTGKTTLARIFAKTINCLDPQMNKEKKGGIRVEPCNKCDHCKLIQTNRAIDLVEIDAASHTSVENIRQLNDSITLPPTTFKYKIYIIDEVHMLSTGAFNALLKTLEEPPAHAIFILATTELHKVPETIISRCQRFDISHLSQDQIIKRLGQIAKSEKVEIEPDALETIAIEAEGGMRDAESLLGQIISLEDKSITAQEVHDILGTSSKRVVREFAEVIAKKDISSALDQINKLQNEGINLKNFNKALLSFFRAIAIIKTCGESSHKILSTLSSEQFQQSEAIAKVISLEDNVRLIEILQKSLGGYKDTAIPQLPLEMAAIEFSLSALEKAPEDQKKTTDQDKTIPDKQEKKGQVQAPAQEEHSPQPSSPKVKEVAEERLPENEEKQETPKAEEKPKSRPSGKIPSFEQILELWSEIIKGVKPHNHSIHAFLENCLPCGIKENTLYIKTKYDFYKNKLSERQNRLTVQEVIDKITGTDLNISFLTESECQSMNFPQAKENEKKNNNILHDAMKMFGGKITKK